MTELTNTNQRIPLHVAIIMDGNARWAKSKNLSLINGHKKGADNIELIVKKAKKIGVKILTLFAFSTENWKRPKEEVSYLMKLLKEYLESKFLQKMNADNVKVNFIGDLSVFSESIKNLIKNTINITKNNSGFILNIALNYGGRDEIIRAIKKLIEAKETNIDEETFAKKYLDTKDYPDPELLIRTGGNFRISNFLLWQIAYTEIYVTNTFWPDFNGDELEKAIKNFYMNEKRNFGGRIE
ncbi:MAG: di-trans,poly-cis-decaprenylcistransferase [Elusimicrobiota bacterium]|jgi:undecaprenyl diphosphate synthase|nr:di-trans,poly-cis-decaprenylcistransferase [Elusimicrobiota bacterium]